MMKVYLDNAATTAIDPRVLEAMMPYFTDHFGNPSSIHSFGRKTRQAIEKSRKSIAEVLGASTAEVFFTSCGTESNNMVIKQSVYDLGVTRIISSPIEHHCVLHSVAAMRREGIHIDMVRVNEYGEPDYDHLTELLSSNPAKTLVTIMHANNELGTIADIHRIGALCAAHGAYFHTDTVQTVGYYPIQPQEIKAHFISGSGHKIYGPKGAGFVYISSDAMLTPFIDGGSQERKMRAGTENIYGIVGLAKALELSLARMTEVQHYIIGLKTHMIARLSTELPDVAFNSYIDERCHYKILSVSLPSNSKTDLLIFNLDIAGIAASGGSACASGSEVGSHVLAGIGAASDRRSVRFSFSHTNTIAEIDLAVDELVKMCAAKAAVIV
jgi:cysteine desulfurase